MIANVLLALLLLQSPRRSAPRQQQSANPQGSVTDAVAAFSGVFKAADKKFVTIDVENGQTMRMFITGSTKFTRDGKAAHAADFESGEDVTVYASRDARMNLLAVEVAHVKAAKAPPKP